MTGIRNGIIPSGQGRQDEAVIVELHLRSVFGSCMLRLIELFTRNLPEGWAELDKASDPMANPSMDSIRGAWERASKRH